MILIKTFEKVSYGLPISDSAVNNWIIEMHKQYPGFQIDKIEFRTEVLNEDKVFILTIIIYELPLAEANKEGA